MIRVILAQKLRTMPGLARKIVSFKQKHSVNYLVWYVVFWVTIPRWSVSFFHRFSHKPLLSLLIHSVSFKSVTIHLGVVDAWRMQSGPGLPFGTVPGVPALEWCSANATESWQRSLFGLYFCLARKCCENLAKTLLLWRLYLSEVKSAKRGPAQCKSATACNSLDSLYQKNKFNIQTFVLIFSYF